MKHLFIPNEKNNYIPHLLHKKAFLVYIVVIMLFNSVLGALGLLNISAAVDIQSLLNAHNNERSLAGISSLTLNTTLNVSASNKAQAMLNSNCWSHYCPDGKSPWEFFDEAGYIYTFAGENLAEGFDSIEAVMSAWMNSPTHRENVLNSNFTEIGFGFAYGTFQEKTNNTIIAVHFGKPYTQVIQATTPVIAPEVIPNEISLNYPTSGSVLNKSEIEIAGTVSPENSNIGVFVNDEEAGKVNAVGSNYVYREFFNDGSHILKSKLYDSEGNVLAESNVVDFSVDTLAPQYIDNSLSLYDKTDENFTLQIEIDYDPVSVKSDFMNFEFVKGESKHWLWNLKEEEVILFDDIMFTILDSAGNSTELTITSDEIRDLLEGKNEIIPISELNEKSIFSSFFNKLVSGDIQSIITFGFIFYLLVLFVIDFYVLVKIDMVSVIKRRSNLHIGTLAILLILLNIGTATGNILTGLGK